MGVVGEDLGGHLGVFWACGGFDGAGKGMRAETDEEV